MEDEEETPGELELPDLPELSGADRKSKRYEPFFLSACLKIEKFTKEWNANEMNRDKSFQVLQGLVQTKDNIQDNLKEMLERNGKVEDALIKGE